MFSFANCRRFIFYNCNRPAYTLSVLRGATGCIGRGCGLPVHMGAGKLNGLCRKESVMPRLTRCVSSISVDLGTTGTRRCGGIAEPAFSGTCRTVLSFTRRYGHVVGRARLSVISMLPRRSVGAYRRVTSREKVRLGVHRFSGWTRGVFATGVLTVS